MISLPPMTETAARPRGTDGAGREPRAADRRADFPALLADVAREPRTPLPTRERIRSAESPLEVSGSSREPLASDSSTPHGTAGAQQVPSTAETATSVPPGNATTGKQEAGATKPLESASGPGVAGSPATDGTSHDPLSRTAGSTPAFTAPVSPGAATPGAATPGAATPGAATPGAATPGAATPGAATDGAEPTGGPSVGSGISASIRGGGAVSASRSAGVGAASSLPASQPGNGGAASVARAAAAPDGSPGSPVETGIAGARSGSPEESLAPTGGRPGESSGGQTGNAPGNDRSSSTRQGRSVPAVPGQAPTGRTDGSHAGAGERVTTAATAPTTVAGQPGGAGLGQDSDPAGTPQRPVLAAPPAGSGTQVDDAAGRPVVSAAEPTISVAEGAQRVSDPLPTALREPLRPADFVERVRDLIARRSAGGRTEVRLALDPPTLGQVRLRITQVGESIRLQLTVENAAAARALDRQMPGLSSALARLGTTLEEASVRLVEMSGVARHESGGQGRERSEDQTSTSDTERDGGEMGGGSGRRRGPTAEETFAELVGDVPAGDGRARRPAAGAGADAGVAKRPTGDGMRGRAVDRIA